MDRFEHRFQESYPYAYAEAKIAAEDTKELIKNKEYSKAFKLFVKTCASVCGIDLDLLKEDLKSILSFKKTH